MNRNKQNLILKWWEPHGAAPRSLRDPRRLHRERHGAGDEPTEHVAASEQLKKR